MEREGEKEGKRKAKLREEEWEGGRQIDFSPSTNMSDRVERSKKRSADGKSNEELMTMLYED